MFLLPFLLSLQPSADTSFTIGTYTAPDGSRGIYQASLNPETGRISPPQLVAEADNPSFVTYHPRGRFLYSVRERGDGEISSYAIENDGKLRFLNKRSTEGADPCHLAVDPSGTHIYVANYSGGNVVEFKLESDGRIGERLSNFQATGTGPNRGRQEKPHLHAVGTDPEGRFVIACDLGTDSVYVFAGPKTAPQLSQPIAKGTVSPGGGPRHFVLSRDGRHLYANEEMQNRVAVFRRDPTKGTLERVQVVSSLPEGFKGYSSSAEILLHPTGKWLYVSNRGHNTVTVFAIETDGTLRQLQVANTVRTPRGMDIDPSGRWLVVASQEDHQVVSMRIDSETGMLGRTGNPVKVGTPVCIVFDRG